MINHAKLGLLKKLFYTNLTSKQLQGILDVGVNEFYKLLKITKRDLGLPEDYYRTPQSYDGYNRNSYLLQLIHEDGYFDIDGYYPLKDTVMKLKETYEEEYDLVNVMKASDETMINLLHLDFYNNIDSNGLMEKYQLPYLQYYRLLNLVKETYNIKESKAGSNTRYIYEYGNQYQIKKQLDHVQHYFGTYNNYNDAEKVRNYLEKHQWSINWEESKEEILKELEIMDKPRIKCKYCGKTFTRTYPSMKYCSSKCRKNAKLEQDCDNSFKWYHNNKDNLDESRRYGLGSGRLGPHMSKEGFHKEAKILNNEFKRLNLNKKATKCLIK